MREGNKNLTLTPNCSLPYTHTITSSPSTPTPLLKVRGWKLRFKRFWMETVPQYDTIGEITLETSSWSVATPYGFPYSSNKLKNTPHLNIKVDIFPTFYHISPLYHYCWGARVCSSTRLFFCPPWLWQVVSTPLHLGLRNPQKWAMTHCHTIVNLSTNPLVLWKFRKCNDLRQIVMFFIWKCGHFFVYCKGEAGGLNVGLATRSLDS